MKNNMPFSGYPRVLLINRWPLNKNYATGFAIFNLFSDWPKDRIAQIYIDDVFPDNELYVRSWKLKFEDRRYMPGLLRAVIRNLRGTKDRVEASSNDEHRQVFPKTNTVGSRSVRKRIRSFMARLINLFPYRISEELKTWVLDFRPELIYSVLEAPHITTLVRDLVIDLNIPIAPHFMDDWLRTNFSGADNNGILGRRLIRDAEWLIRYAPVRLAISELMVEEYKKRYGLPFLPFMNCVNVKNRALHANQTNIPEVFRFAYVGSVHLGREEVLLDIARALKQLREEGINGEIVIYGGRIAKEDFAGLYVPLTMRFATEEEKSLLDTPDAAIEAFVHVDSFELEYTNYLRFSLSAKVPWCTAAGVPIFAYGPADIGTIKYLRQSGAAIVVERKDQALLREELRRLLLNVALQRQLGDAARLMAKTYHDASIVREEFRRVLTSITVSQ